MITLDSIYNRLRRKTASTTFIPQIDGLRFLAVAIVVIFHMHSFMISKIPGGFSDSAVDPFRVNKFLESAGHKGVLLFFVISGFILGMPFAKYFLQGAKKVSLKAYFLRRLTRLELPYFFNIIAAAFLIIWFGRGDFANMFVDKGLSGMLSTVGASLAYLHNIIFPAQLSVNPVAWSLEIEVQFYLLAPLLVFVFALPALFRRLVVGFLVIFFATMQNYFPLPVLTLYGYIQYFLLGFLVLDLYLSGFKLQLRPAVNVLLGLLALFLFFYLDAFSIKNFSYLFIASLFFLALVAVTNDFWAKVFSLRVLTSIGGMCYTIYLWHTQVISAVGNFSVKFNIFDSYSASVLSQMLILTPFILGASVFLFLLIEKPCMDREWPKKLWNFLRRKKIPEHPVLENI